jgi:hypothetical protein
VIEQPSMRRDGKKNLKMVSMPFPSLIIVAFAQIMNLYFN